MDDAAPAPAEEERAPDEAPVPEPAPAPVPVIPPDTSIHLHEFARDKSGTVRSRIELLHGFVHHARTNGKMRMTRDDFEAAFTAFSNAPAGG